MVNSTSFFFSWIYQKKKKKVVVLWASYGHEFHKAVWKKKIYIYILLFTFKTIGLFLIWPFSYHIKNNSCLFNCFTPFRISFFNFLISNPSPVISVSKWLFFADIILYPLPILVILLCFYCLYHIIFLQTELHTVIAVQADQKSTIYVCLYSDSFPKNSQNSVYHLDDCWWQLIKSNVVYCCVCFFWLVVLGCFVYVMFVCF